jgi:hypothetical protein
LSAILDVRRFKLSHPLCDNRILHYCAERHGQQARQSNPGWSKLVGIAIQIQMPRACTRTRRSTVLSKPETKAGRRGVIKTVGLVISYLLCE